MLVGGFAIFASLLQYYEEKILHLSCVPPRQSGRIKKKEKRIMAKPIKETPVLYDNDAERLEMLAHNVVPLSEEERREIVKAYDDVRKCCAS